MTDIPATVPNRLVPIIVSPEPLDDLASGAGVHPAASISSPSPKAPHPKKSKLLRRLLDLFHLSSSHENKHMDQDEAVVPIQATAAMESREKQRYGRIEKFFAQFRHHHTPECPCPEQSGNVMVPVEASVVSTPIHHHSPIIIPPDCRSPHHLGRFHVKFFDFLSGTHEEKDRDGHLRPHKPTHTRSTSRGSKHSDDETDINECDLDIVKQKIPTVSSTSDLSFKRKYRFIGNRVIGKGASGVVRLGCSVHDSQSPRATVLAVKEFRKRRKHETSTEYLNKLTSEFCIAASMKHQNVVHTMDIVYDGKKWYEIMEYCPNGDLFSFIQAGGLTDIAEIDCCFKQLVEGVKYMHSMGIAHRDLKPENLLIDDHGQLKITDFGVSDVFLQSVEKCNGEPCLSKGFCGSSPYIPPEEYLGCPYDARKVDVWAMGIIYYAMVFHGVPWEAANLKDSNYCHYLHCGGGKFEPFNRLASGARSLLKRILEPDPTKRISIDEIMNDEWFKKIELVPLSNCRLCDTVKVNSPRFDH